MKKIVSIILTMCMLFSLATVISAEEITDAERLAGSVYIPVEMEMLTDLFATKAERRGEDWINPESYHAWLGFGSSNDKIPFVEKRTKLTHGGAFAVDQNETTSLKYVAEMKNGRYVLTIGEIPYRLGKITEGVLDANAFSPGLPISNVENNLFKERMDKKFAMYTSDETYYTIYSGKFPVQIPTEKINIVTTSTQNQKTAANYCLYAVAAKVYLDNGETVDYTLLTGEGYQDEGVDINDAVVFVPKNSATEYNSYAAINGAIGTEVKTLADMEGVKLSDIKLPSAPSVAGPYVPTQCYQGFGGEKVTAKRQFYYQNVILPEALQVLDVDRNYTTKAYAGSFEITAPEGTKITAVEFMHDNAGYLAYDKKGAPTYADTVGAFKSSDTSSSAYLLVPATVEGVEDYDAYVRIKKNANYSAILGMTSETTAQNAKEKIEALMKDAKTLDDIDAVEELKEFIDGKNLLITDISETVREKYDALVENIDVSAEVEAVTVTDKAVVNVNITNYARLAGKNYMVVVAFYDSMNRLIEAVPQKFTTTATRNIKETVTVDNVPENTVSTQVYVWKDFLSIISLID